MAIASESEDPAYLITRMNKPTGKILPLEDRPSGEATVDLFPRRRPSPSINQQRNIPQVSTYIE